MSEGKRKVNFSGQDEIREFDKTKRPKAVSSDPAVAEEEENELQGEETVAGATQRAAERDADREAAHTLESDEEEAGEEQGSGSEDGDGERPKPTHGGGRYEMEEEDLHEELDENVRGAVGPRLSDRFLANTVLPCV